MSPSAIIVGAGIGGVGAALAMRRIGWDVTVLERVERRQDVGAGLSLAPNALRVLDRLGVGDAVRATGVPTQATGNIRTPAGDQLVGPLDGDPPLLAVERSRLRETLVSALPAGMLRTGVEVRDAGPDGDGMIVRSDAGTERADLVIAADGIHSRMRRLVEPGAVERFLGRTGWLGLADLDEPVGPGGAPGFRGSMTLGRGRYTLLHPVGDRRVYWAVVEPAPRPGLREDDERAAALTRVRDWHDPIPRVIRATPPHRVTRVDIHEVPALHTFVRRRLVLLGDAAHGMSPDRGQGAAQSLEDAVVLAAALRDVGTIDEGLAAYDRLRRPRSQAIARDARRVGDSTTRSGALGYRALTTMMRLMPRSAWERASRPDANPVWRWEPPAL